MRPSSPEFRAGGALASILLASVALAWAGGAAAEGDVSGMSAERLTRIDDMVQRYVEEGRLPGAVVAVSRNARQVHLSSIGPYADDSLFRIYSMTKPVTIVAVLALYEEGAFMLGDPVAMYLPEFADMRVYAGADPATGQPLTVPARAPITIEHLLTHTAGLSYGGDPDGVSQLYSASDIWEANSLADFTVRLARLPLAFEPGTRWHYSVAMDVLSRLVEVVADRPFDEFLHARIIDPLKMTDTGFHVPREKLSRFVPMYRRNGDGMTLADAPEDSPYRDPGRVPYGGHGLVSTARDYMRFAQMLLNEGELDGARILSRKTVELMRMDHLGRRLGEIPLDAEWIGNTENRRADPDVGFGFGYGVYVITDVARNAVPGSVGTYAWGGAASTYFFIDPQERLIGLFLTQLRPSDAYPLRAQFRGLVYQGIVDGP